MKYNYLLISHDLKDFKILQYTLDYMLSDKMINKYNSFICLRTLQFWTTKHKLKFTIYYKLSHMKGIDDFIPVVEPIDEYYTNLLKQLEDNINLSFTELLNSYEDENCSTDWLEKY